jgi:hypothetical protein
MMWEDEAHYHRASLDARIVSIVSSTKRHPVRVKLDMWCDNESPVLTKTDQNQTAARAKARTGPQKPYDNPNLAQV